MDQTLEKISVSVLICTRNRPRGFAALVGSLTQMSLPDKVILNVCVSDNNTSSQIDGYILQAFENTGLTYQAEHEPVAGYSSARNRTLKLALETSSDYFLITDDDLMADQLWLAEHLKAFQQYGSDINCGVQSAGRNSRVDGQIIENVFKRVGTFNLAFRRSVISSDGLGLRFDPSFNETGGEDSAFVHEAQKSGAKIVFSSKARVHQNEPSWHTHPAEAFKAALNLAQIRYVKHNNEMAKSLHARDWSDVVKRLLKTIPDSLSFLGLFIVGWVVTPFKKISGLKLRARAHKNLCKLRGTFSGLSGQTLSRSQTRRDDITD